MKTTRFFALMAAMIGGALMFATPARADTITVTVTVDGIDSAPGDGACAGPNGCTLRAAIMEANARPGADEIVLGTGNFGLTRAGNDDTAVNGDLDITDTLTLKGAGYAVTIVDGGTFVSPDRIFQVLTGTQVSMSGFEIKRGKAAAGGGGIHNAGILTLTQMRLFTNTAAYGGALYNATTGQIILDQSQVVTNSATNIGGGVLANGPMTLTQSRLSGNVAGTNGAALYIDASLSVADSVFQNNRATVDGGAIYIPSGPAASVAYAIANSQFRSNRAQASNGYGGAIYANGGTLTVTGSLFDGNYAGFLGGALSLGVSPYNVLLDGNDFSNNDTTKFGGAIYASGDGLTRMIGGSLLTNDAGSGEGGGIYKGGTGMLSISGTLIAANNANKNGGALAAIGGEVYITNASLQLNTTSSGSGGAISTSTGSPLYLFDTTISQNSAFLAGGGVAGGQSPTLVRGGLFENNQTTGASSSGGAIAVSFGRLETRGATFRLNRSGAYGGAIGHEDDFSNGLLIEDCVLEQNAAGRGGGVSGGMMDIRRSLFISNTAKTGSGGAAANGIGNMSVSDSRFVSNTAVSGGALAASDGNETVLRSVFDSNVALMAGGAIDIGAFGLVVKDSLFIRNQTAGQGGAIWGSDGAPMEVNDSAFFSNTAAADAGAIQASLKDLYLVNTTLSGNRANRDGGAVWATGANTVILANATIVNNVADADANGTGNGGGLNADPANTTVNLRNSILNGNTDLSPVEKYNECVGLIISGDYNLVGAAPGCVLAGTTTHNSAAAPMLGALAGNGSATTLSFKPMAGSPAIDGGNPAGCKDQNGVNLTHDQRKLQRPLDGNADGAAVCDIGAVEAGSFMAMLPRIAR
jgi:predicted outer membrane repeat protein